MHVLFPLVASNILRIARQRTHSYTLKIRFVTESIHPNLGLTLRVLLQGIRHRLALSLHYSDISRLVCTENNTHSSKYKYSLKHSR